MQQDIRRAKVALKQRVKAFGVISDFVDLIMTSIVPLNDVTVLLPMEPRTLRFMMNAFSYQKQQQLTAYHVLDGRYNYRKLRRLPNGKQLKTLEGKTLIKRGRQRGLLTGLKGKGRMVARIVMPHLFNGSQFMIHGISHVVVPADIY